ncbi:MAG: cyclic nucleotide-binding domain-containing protein [Anaerolineae bacterium]|nr:cyclic nucleotide-binding domain-containing protein [Anaerolineae bacterium]MDK1081413.1 cyclic nucleotide-binding domain-containing protein [Anaerolineae bacterium]MDK1118879.1 cyclic nucleotide-binding domain-containing protein [Anaerolineae bacterium]
MEATDRAIFLQKVHLFHDLTDDQLLKVAERTYEVNFDAGEMILEQDTVGDSFYLIYSGKVRVVHRKKDGHEQVLATLVSGDYMGELELFSGELRSASVVADGPTLLLRFDKEDFDEILKRYPSIKPNLEISIASRKLARTMRFKWLYPDEVVYFLARKHSFFLLKVLILPVLGLLIPAFFLIWGTLTQSATASSIGVIALVLDLGWIAWSAIDWSNDYYVVTNQRVVWLEKVIGLYDSRSEAPLTEILSIGVDTDLVGRIMDYGNVLVHTFVGSIPFKHVLHPHQAANMVEEYWKRSQQIFEKEEKEAFKTVLRHRLGLLESTDENKELPEQERKSSSQSSYRPNFFKLLIINIFKQRIEDGDTITYRKHWVVLIRKILFPSTILLILLGMTAARLFTLALSPDLTFIYVLSDGTRGFDTISISLPLIMIPVFGWWLYQYMDWTNDIFRVTGDQIMDVDRKPFGTEERRAAPLDNVLGTQYKRVGVFGYIFNYGTVYIDVGSAQIAFEDVLDPAIVQSDINRRRLARASEKKKIEQINERNRMADWMATYHNNLDEFRQDEERKKPNSKSE